jgi:hypothetical protein
MLKILVELVEMASTENAMASAKPRVKKPT